jgi:hypothetical protein
MPPQQSSDPAARLITILQAALQTRPNTTYLQFWATAFNVDAKNVPAIYHHIALLQQLVDDVEAGIKKAPHITRPEQYLEPLTQLRAIIAQQNLQAGWQRQRELLSMTINSLRFTSERLQEYSPEPDLQASELEAIHKQATDLITKLHSSQTIPKPLKLILFDLLNGIQRSINEYRFRGIRGVREQLFVIASQMQQHSPEFEKAKDAPEVKGFVALLKQIDTITAAALHVKELISVVTPLLPAIPPLVQHLLQ